MAKRKQSDSDYLTTCRERVTRSLKWRKDEGYDELWHRMIDLYRGQSLDGLSDEDKALVNLAFATANVIYPTVSVSNPKFLVNPTHEELIDAAQVAEAATNYWWRHYRFLPEWRQGVKDSVVVGHGWVKTGWLTDEGEEPRDPDDVENDFYNALDQQNAAVADPENGLTEADMPLESDVRAGIPTTEMVTYEDRPFVERVSPFDMVIDPDATNEREMRWIAQRIVVDWDDFQADDRFDKKVRASTPKQNFRGDDDERNRDSREGEKACYAVYFEYYDLRKRTMCVFGQGGEGFLVKPQRVPLPYDNPFTLIPNYEVPEYFYPMGDLESIETLQRELNDTRSQMFNDRKRYIPKYLAKEGAFNEEARNLLQGDVHNAIVEVTGNVDLREAIQPLPQTDVRAELYQQSQQIEGDINNVSGVSDYQRGALPEIRRTATEASIIQDTANARAADKLSSIEWRLAEVGYRLLQLAQTHMDGEQVVRIVGEDGSMNWVSFTPEDIQGEFDFEVEMGSTKPSNESTKAQRSMQLVDAISPWIGSGYLNETEIVKHVLYGFGVKDPDRFISAQPPMPQIDPMTGQPMQPPLPGEEAPGGQGAPPPPPEGYQPDMGALAGVTNPLQSAFSGVAGA